MPAIMTLGGIALSVLGLLVAFAGMPDRAAGLGLGSDLIQTGAAIFAGGLIVAALGQVLRALREVADRVEEAGFGLSGPRPSMNDALAQETPMPLPRANARNAAPEPQDEFSEIAAAATPPSRAPRAPRAAREPQPQPQPQAAPRTQPRPDPRREENFEPQQDEDLAGDFPVQREQPRWMRAQAETASRQPSAGVIPLQSGRQSRTAPAVSAGQPRREQPAAAYEGAAAQRRQPAPEPLEEESGEVSVVRSGIIGGMAYTLYSDGAIEAELPSGMVRFNSFAELQEHVKRAGADDPDADYRGPNAAQH
jgi:hypothetical protein